MPETITKPHESEELQEHQRAMAQLRQAEEFTMGGHVRSKLRTLRNRLKKTLTDHEQLDGESANAADDDMQLLARDITFNEPQKTQPAMPEPAKPAEPVKAAVKSRLPAIAALALGLSLPTTTGIIMAPKIIEAWHGKQPVVKPMQEYAPILLPGKPNGVK